MTQWHTTLKARFLFAFLPIIIMTAAGSMALSTYKESQTLTQLIFHSIDNTQAFVKDDMIGLLTHSDQINPADIVDTLRINKLIIAAVLFDNQHNIVFQYQHTNTKPLKLSHLPTIEQSDSDGFFHHYASISQTQETIGAIYIRIDKSTITQLHTRNLQICMAVFIFLLLVTYLISINISWVFEQSAKSITQLCIRLQRESQKRLRLEDSEFSEINHIHHAINDILDHFQSVQSYLLDTKQQAELATQEKTQLLMDLSKEFKSPLSDITELLYNLKDSAIDNIQKDHAHAAFSSGQQLLSIINDMLDYSKIESGQLTIENIEFDLHNFLHKITQYYKPLAAQKHNQFINLISPKVPTRIISDPTRLRQVINNLIDNAIRFTCHGEITLHTTRHSTHNNELTLYIEVTDTGSGIAEEHQKNMFTTRWQTERADPAQAAGLGLVVCDRIVNKMKGHISVDSTPHQGSRFYFTIQCMPVSSLVKPISPIYFQEEKIQALVIGLIPKAEDKIPQRLAQLNINYQHQIIDSQTRKLTNPIKPITPAPNVILVDCVTCDVDAFQYIIHARNQFGHQLRFILVCSVGKVGDGKLAHTYGYDAYLNWPFELEHLNQTIDQVMHLDFDDYSHELITRHTLAEQDHAQQPIALIISTQPLIQKQLTMALQQLDYWVDNVLDEDSSFALAAETSYAIAFIDTPIEDNLNQLPLTVRSSPSIPIIVLVDNQPQPNPLLTTYPWLDDALIKPINPDTFKQSLSHWTRSKALKNRQAG